MHMEYLLKYNDYNTAIDEFERKLGVATVP